jgi:hypothetical protein
LAEDFGTFFPELEWEDEEGALLDPLGPLATYFFPARARSKAGIFTLALTSLFPPTTRVLDATLFESLPAPSPRGLPAILLAGCEACDCGVPGLGTITVSDKSNKGAWAAGTNFASLTTLLVLIEKF